MSWSILKAEPAYGICDQCKKHTCGIVDGEHKWIRTGIFDKSGDAIIIGYGCVELWAANLGMTKEFIEVMVPVPPTDEQLYEIFEPIREMVKQSWGPITQAPGETNDQIGNIPMRPGTIIPIPTDRASMKAWLDERGISYFKGLKDDKLRELVMQHAQS